MELCHSNSQLEILHKFAWLVVYPTFVHIFTHLHTSQVDLKPHPQQSDDLAPPKPPPTTMAWLLGKVDAILLRPPGPLGQHNGSMDDRKGTNGTNEYLGF